RTRTRSRGRRCSRRPRRTTSAGSTSCARSAASTRACRAASNCTSARGRRSGRSTRRCSVRMVEAVPALDDGAARERVARVDALLQDLESAIGAVPVDTAIELAQALLDLYGEGLARIVGHIADRDHDGELARALASDELVSHLLLLHGLHPVPLDTRVRGALAEVRPYLESHGGDVDLLGIDDGVVRLAMRGSCDGCASATMTLKLAIEDAIQKAAPDVEAVVAEGAVEPAPAPLLQIELSQSWAPAGDLGDLSAPVVR